MYFLLPDILFVADRGPNDCTLLSSSTHYQRQTGQHNTVMLSGEVIGLVLTHLQLQQLSPLVPVVELGTVLVVVRDQLDELMTLVAIDTMPEVPPMNLTGCSLHHLFY